MVHPVQLMCILPQDSKELLPINYRKFMNSKSEIGIYYQGYKLDTFFKRYNWMCPPILPNINISVITKSFRKIKLNEKIKQNILKNSEMVYY